MKTARAHATRGTRVLLRCAALAGAALFGPHLVAAQGAETATVTAALEAARLPNNVPFLNTAGAAATFSTAGFVELENEFHTPQGANGRSCATCHLPQAGWSIRPFDVELRFLLSRGLDPLFNVVDADSPGADVSTPAARFAAYSMLRKGLFRRGGDLTAAAEFAISAVDDPLGAGGSATRFEFFRRPLATANFHIARNVGWHDQNTNGSGNVGAGLAAQASGNITGAQQGSPASAQTIASIVGYEAGLSFAQQFAFGAGALTACGRGGPENLSLEAPRDARFDLYDAWIGLVPGACGSRSADRKRAQIARGQELFNATNPGGRSCRGCHNAANNGSNVNGTLFDIGTSRIELRRAGMPLYTLRNKTTLEERRTTDPGRAVRSGRWADIDRFKVPSLRGTAARAPYFHNGSAATLNEVIAHYERTLGFVFTRQERADLLAFLQSL